MAGIQTGVFSQAVYLRFLNKFHSDCLILVQNTLFDFFGGGLSSFELWFVFELCALSGSCMAVAFILSELYCYIILWSVLITVMDGIVQGSYWQIGDVVAVTDIDDGEKYYAQLRGFLEDQYYQKSAVITWLVPSPHGHSAQSGFDPSLYVAGFTPVLFILTQVI